VSLLEILREVAARLAWVSDELEPAAREQALASLEEDLAGWLAEYEDRCAA
jgi:hypothetical protein